MMPLTVKESQSYHDLKACYICKKKFSIDDKKYYKVRDHCHFTGKYRDTAQNIFNLKYKTPKNFL